jgi:hypothetical protein
MLSSLVFKTHLLVLRLVQLLDCKGSAAPWWETHSALQSGRWSGKHALETKQTVDSSKCGFNDSLHFLWSVQPVYEHWDQDDRLQQRVGIQSWDPWQSDTRSTRIVCSKKRGVMGQKNNNCYCVRCLKKIDGLQPWHWHLTTVYHHYFVPKISQVQP